MTSKSVSDLRLEIVSVLGNKQLKYFQLMRKYFSGCIEQAKFQSEIDHLFTPESRKLHYELLRSLLGQKIAHEPTPNSIKGSLNISIYKNFQKVANIFRNF